MGPQASQTQLDLPIRTRHSLPRPLASLAQPWPCCVTSKKFLNLSEPLRPCHEIGRLKTSAFFGPCDSQIQQKAENEDSTKSSEYYLYPHSSLTHGAQFPGGTMCSPSDLGGEEAWDGLCQKLPLLKSPHTRSRGHPSMRGAGRAISSSCRTSSGITGDKPWAEPGSPAFRDAGSKDYRWPVAGAS